jgi:hypothetical protein
MKNTVLQLRHEGDRITAKFLNHKRLPINVANYIQADRQIKLIMSRLACFALTDCCCMSEWSTARHNAKLSESTHSSIFE